MPIVVLSGSSSVVSSEAGTTSSIATKEDAAGEPTAGRGACAAAGSPPQPASPCQSCGACCISFRVDFSIYELDDMGGTVPPALAVEINGAKCRMRGTDQFPLRCVALGGEVGKAVGCTIYDRRPRPCRELEPGSYGCERARARHGLPSLISPD